MTSILYSRVQIIYIRQNCQKIMKKCDAFSCFQKINFSPIVSQKLLEAERCALRGHDLTKNLVFWRFLIKNVYFAEDLLVSNGVASRPGVRHSSEPRKRFPNSGSSDEDPYSLTPSGSSGSSGKGNKDHHNSRLPAGDKEFFGPQNWAKVIKWKSRRKLKTLQKLSIFGRRFQVLGQNVIYFETLHLKDFKTSQRIIKWQ